MGRLGTPSPTPSPSPSRDYSAFIASVDALAAEALQRGPVAGLSIAVVEHGKAVLEKGYGYADQEAAVPATPETSYPIASVSKHFTAGLILRLADQGKLGLDDPLKRFFPSARPRIGDLTIRHLLDHTSGLSRGGPAPRAAALSVLTRGGTARAQGEDWDYSNYNYSLLGLVIEQASGRDYSRFVHDEIVVPLGLTGTGYCEDGTAVPGRGLDYQSGVKSVSPTPYWTEQKFFAAGGLCSTVLDLVRWEKALEEITQALELNPRDFSVLEQITLTYEALGRYQEMAETLDRVLAIAPKDVPTRARRALVDLERGADVRAFETTIDAIMADDPNASLGFTSTWLLIVLRERDSVGAQHALSNIGTGGCFDESIPFPDGWCKGLVALVRGDQSTARAAFDTARKELTEEVHSQPNYAAALCALGVVDAVLGNKDDAIREGERAIELTPLSKNAIEGATLVRYLAVIYAWAGDKDRAIQRLAETTYLPGSHISYGYLRLHPLWDPLRSDPRFQAIVDSLAPK